MLSIYKIASLSNGYSVNSGHCGLSALILLIAYIECHFADANADADKPLYSIFDTAYLWLWIS